MVTTNNYAGLQRVMVLSGLYNMLLCAHTNAVILADEQDQLADLLTRMFEEFSKSADMVEPPVPPIPALNSASLSTDYDNVVQQLRQLVKS